MPQDRPIYPYRGPLSTSGIEDLRDGKFRRERGAFRVDIGNEGWNFVVGGFGGDPNITTRDFVNGMNASGLNSKEISGLDRDNAALFGPQLAQTLNNLISRQIRMGFLVEQAPDTSNSVTLSAPSITDGGWACAAHRSATAFPITPGKACLQPQNVEPHLRQDGSEAIHQGPAGRPDPLRGRCRWRKSDAQLHGRRPSHGDLPDGQQRQGLGGRFVRQRSWDHKNLFLVGSGTFPRPAPPIRR